MYKVHFLFLILFFKSYGSELHPNEYRLSLNVIKSEVIKEIQDKFISLNGKTDQIKRLKGLKKKLFYSWLQNYYLNNLKKIFTLIDNEEFSQADALLSKFNKCYYEKFKSISTKLKQLIKFNAMSKIKLLKLPYKFSKIHALKLNDQNDITCISWSLDGEKLIATTPKGLLIYSVNTWDCQHIEMPIKYVESVFWSPDSKKLALCSKYFPKIVIYDFSKNKFIDCFKNVNTAEKGIVSINWSPCSNKFIVNTACCSVKIFNLDCDREFCSFRLIDYATAMHWSIDGQSIIYSLSDEQNTIYSIDIQTLKDSLLYEHRVNKCKSEEPVDKIIYYNENVIVSTSNKLIIFWDIDRNVELKRFVIPEKSELVQVSSDGKLVAYSCFVSNSGHYEVHIWDIENQPILVETLNIEGDSSIFDKINFQKIISLDWYPDSKALAIASDKEVHIWKKQLARPN
ncbi:MAG: hypothetical protein P4L22_07085 [Candidatus Babeliales bacterium]|nr:hypothetical protein [Candidatus Babeliales bacterium]